MEKTIKVSSDIKNISVAESIVDSLTLEYDLNPDLYGNILVSLHEAINNAIVHGNHLNANKFVEITFILEKNSLKFCVKDNGEGFDYNNVPDPTLPENIEKPSGRGIFIIRNLADQVVFLSKGTEIQFTFGL
jgi:serine/threonine-protein kinase RsbW